MKKLFVVVSFLSLSFPALADTTIPSVFSDCMIPVKDAGKVQSIDIPAETQGQKIGRCPTTLVLEGPTESYRKYIYRLSKMTNLYCTYVGDKEITSGFTCIAHIE